MTPTPHEAARRAEKCKHCDHGPNYWNHVRGELFLHEYEPDQPTAEQAAHDTARRAATEVLAEIYALSVDQISEAYDGKEITLIADAIAQARAEELADVLGYLEQLAESHPHAAQLYRHAAHQLTSLNHLGVAALRAATPTGGRDE